MTGLDLARLRAVAEAVRLPAHLYLACSGPDGYSAETVTKFYAEFDPPTVLALIDLAERAESAEPCICNTGPDTDGPDECCPQHGRAYSDWVEYAGVVETRVIEQSRRAQVAENRALDAEVAVERVRALADECDERERKCIGLPDEVVRADHAYRWAAKRIRRALDGGES